MILPSLIAAVIPMVIYLLLIWSFDRYEKEPFILVLRNYMWGALGAIFFSFIGSWLITTVLSAYIYDSVYLKNLEVFAVAPVVEETMKGLFLVLTISSRKFDNITDGIVYGGAIGLGFGMTENFLYFMTYGSNIDQFIMLVIVRTLFSAVMHCLSTATFGAFLGYSKFRSSAYKVFFPIIGITVAMMIHSTWNLSVSFETTVPYGFIFLFLCMLSFILLFSISLAGEKKIICSELLEETEKGLIPVSHIEYISTPQRKSTGWVDEDIRKPYVQAAVSLAFRKIQLKNSSGLDKIYYQNEVDKYRNSIEALLNNSVNNNVYNDRV